MDYVPLIKCKEVSVKFGLNQQSIYTWVSKGNFPHYRISPKCILFNLSEVDNWIKNKHISPDISGGLDDQRR